MRHRYPGLASLVSVRVPRTDSLAGQALDTRRPQAVGDVRSDPRTAAAAGLVDARSLCAVPLVTRDEPYGAVLLGSPRPGAFGPGALAAALTVQRTAGQVAASAADLAAASARHGHRVGDPSLATFLSVLTSAPTVARGDAFARVADVLDRQAYVVVFQPVVELATGRLAAVEALTRFTATPRRPPQVWFAEAESVGRGVELQLATARAAVRHVGRLPPRVALTLNVGPDALFSRSLLALVESVGPRRVVLELTEHLRVDDYERLRSVLADLRLRGIRLSIDDTGAGFASMRHILELAPEFIKLDRQLIAGIDGDDVRRSMVGALVGFAHTSGIRVVAEGIERLPELQAVRQLGVDFAQGYLLRRPGPLPGALALHTASAGAR